MYACDGPFWTKYADPRHGTTWRGFRGLKVTQDPKTPFEFPEVLRVPGVDEPGLSLDPTVIHFGANSGYQALNIAMLAGASRVVLLGFDAQKQTGKRHWHGDHVTGLNNPERSNFDSWRAAFATVPPDLERAGVEVLNASPASAIETFPRVRLSEVL